MAEARLSVNRTRASGKLVVGMQKAFGHFVAPFLARHPEIALDLRFVRNPKDPMASLVDVLVFIGWLEDTDMVAKRAGQTRYVTCASPAYLKAHGRPQDPDELRGHGSLALRSAWGAVLDLWKYQRGEEVRSVALEPRVIRDDMDWMIEAAVRGAGVLRLIDLKMRPFVEQNLLDPILGDWEALEAPPIHVMYRRGSRPSARVRAFVDFVSEVCADLEAWHAGARQTRFAPVPIPSWFRSNWVGSLTRRAPPRTKSLDRLPRKAR